MFYDICPRCNVFTEYKYQYQGSYYYCSHCGLLISSEVVSRCIARSIIRFVVVENRFIGIKRSAGFFITQNALDKFIPSKYLKFKLIEI